MTPIIDMHVHCFPDRIAPRAKEVLAKNAAKFGILPHTELTVNDTAEKLVSAGISRALVCNIATNAHQEHSVNDFAISLLQNGNVLIPAGSVHPDSPNTVSELDRLCAAGIKGIKIHPDYVGIDITDERFDNIFALAEERRMFVVTHAGFDPVSPGHMHADAKMLAAVKKRRPGLMLIAAHCGGAGNAEEVLEILAGTEIMIDTSLSSTRAGERDLILKILCRHDPNLVFFGTDTPWSDAKEEIRFLERSGLPEDSLERIFFTNAKQLLELEI